MDRAIDRCLYERHVTVVDDNNCWEKLHSGHGPGARLSDSCLDIWAACVAQRPSLYVTGRRMGAQRGEDREG